MAESDRPTSQNEAPEERAADSVQHQLEGLQAEVSSDVEGNLEQVEVKQRLWKGLKSFASKRRELRGKTVREIASGETDLMQGEEALGQLIAKVVTLQEVAEERGGTASTAALATTLLTGGDVEAVLPPPTVPQPELPVAPESVQAEKEPEKEPTTLDDLKFEGEEELAERYKRSVNGKMKGLRRLFGVKEGEPIPPDHKYLRWAKRSARRHGVPEDRYYYIFAIIAFESFNPKAVNSSSGATGFGQFIESTWEEYLLANPDLVFGGKKLSERDPSRMHEEAMIDAIAWYIGLNSRRNKFDLNGPEALVHSYMNHHDGPGGRNAKGQLKGYKLAIDYWNRKARGEEVDLNDYNHGVVGWYKTQHSNYHSYFRWLYRYASAVQAVGNAYRDTLPLAHEIPGVSLAS